MQFKQKESINPDDVRKAIYLIDSYRAHLFYDISWIDKRVNEGKLGNRFKLQWKKLRKVMIKMASVSNEIAGVRKLAKIQNYLEALWQIIIPLIVVTAFLSILAPQSFSLIKGIAVYLTVIAFSSLILGLVGRFMIGGKIGRKIEEHFLRNPAAHEFKIYEVKDAVQLLIDELHKFLKESDQKPSKHRIGLNLMDYKNVKIVKKPKPWRKYYIAEIIL
jgi:hypothetical protein